jgi:hypothetical protein
MFAGIDPGLSGGVAFMNDDGTLESIQKMPETEKDTSDIFSACPPLALAIIERVHSFPEQGVSSSFKFGMHYGLLRGILVSIGIPFEDCPPQTWQRYMNCLTHGDKNISKAKAQQLFPGFKITHCTADAILIAKYAREKYLGLLPPPIKMERRKEVAEVF